MLNTLLAASAAFQPNPIVLGAKPSSISMFKNGFATVVREAKLGGSGEYVLEEMPTAVLGTFWLTASNGVKLREVVVGNEEVIFERPLGSIEEILGANVGKRLTFRMGANRTETGVLEAVQHTLAIIRRDNKSQVALHKGVIQEIEAENGGLIYSVKDKRTRRVMRMQAETPGSGSIFMVTLERGASWAPGYSVDITDPKQLKLVSKATLINDSFSLDNIEARLVTGFPNIPFHRWVDPFTSGQSLQDFVNSLMGMGTPADLRRAGGFGGGGPGGQASNRMAERDFGDAFTTSPLPGLTSEDLFFYRLPGVRLKPGDRGYYILFSMQTPYRHVYEWEMGDSVNDTTYVGTLRGEPEDVWHSLKFKNESKQPFTTAAATVFKDGEILGQDMMSYTSVGAEATVRITKALDVRAESDEEEVDRQREFLKIRSGHYDLVSLKGTLQMVNRKADAVTLQITKVLTGEIKSAEGSPKVTSLAKGLRAVNPRQRLEWTVELKPGEKKTLTYNYTVYVSN